MRALIWIAAAVIGAATVTPPALAQGINASGLRRLPGVDGVETSPLQRLQSDARAWVDQERARQKAKPGDPIALAVDIESEIGPAVLKVARRERIGTGDLILVIMYEITRGASEELEADLRRMRRDGAAEADIQAAVAVKAQLDANIAEIVASQTVVSRSLLSDFAMTTPSHLPSTGR